LQDSGLKTQILYHLLNMFPSKKCLSPPWKWRLGLTNEANKPQTWNIHIQSLKGPDYHYFLFLNHWLIFTFSFGFRKNIFHIPPFALLPVMERQLCSIPRFKLCFQKISGQFISILLGLLHLDQIWKSHLEPDSLAFQFFFYTEELQFALKKSLQFSKVPTI
jgi:hypothetical protein